MSKAEAESEQLKAPGSEKHGNEQDEIANYAENTIQEMLGWYGLQDGASGAVKLLSPSGIDSHDHKVNHSKDSRGQTYTNGWDTRGLHHTESYTNPESPVSEGRRGGGGGSRKLIGMRYLFTPLGDHLSLLEKAKIWVARHDYKYFVGWTEEQLSKVDPILRPISPITPDMYKLHMNRSEYCRNVKLKYCLEADTPWAEEFQEKLAKPASKGGFSGLCQAKIAAAELWRKYSENYKSHQARYPNPKSKYRSRRSVSDAHSSDGSTNSGKAEDLDSEIKEMDDSSMQGEEEQGSEGPRTPVGTPFTIKPEIEDKDDNNCDVTPATSAVTENLSTTTTSVYPTPVSFSPFISTPVTDYSICAMYPNTALMPSKGHCTSPYPSPSDRKPIVFRPSEYKKSERGLSYLFPSLADQQLSLLDKVKVTVMRHKNNYFLNWGEEELKKIDPIVRPKMIVTKDLYKEYCHRNAMKYDSNLQFCMESPEAWAQDFRDRLAKPPSEGGFHSLCEVKQEAGRLWKEHSGRYKMHNVVKAQMDMNSEAAEHNRTEIKVKKRRGGDRSHYGSSNSSPVEDRRSPGSSRSSPSVMTLQRRYTSHSSPYSSMTDVMEESRKRRRLDDSCSSAASSPPIPEDLDYKRHFLPDEAMTHYMPAYLPPLPIPLSLPPADEITLTPPDSDSLFQPLPSTLNIAQQIAVWMERHRNNYYLRVPADSIQHLHPLLKPHYVVTDAVYQRFISKDMVTMFDHVYRILGSSQDWAREYQDRLGKDGGFATLEEALAEAVDIWNRFLSEDKPQCPKCYVNNCNCVQSMQVWTVGDERSSPMNNSSPATQDGSVGVLMGGLQGYPTSTPTLPHHDLSNQEVLDLSIPSSSLSSSSSNGARGPQSETTAGGDGGDGGESPVWTQALVLATLWSSRERLREALHEDPAFSWHNRLQPHLASLRQHLRPDYLCPQDAADCRVDLVLAILQQHFTMAVRQ